MKTPSPGKSGAGLAIRSVCIEDYGGVGRFEAAFGPGLIRLRGKEGRAVAAALAVILKAGAPAPPEMPGARVTAELERGGERFCVTAKWDARAKRFAYAIRENASFEEEGDPAAFLPCEEERSLAFFQPRRNTSLADRLRQYRDPDRCDGGDGFYERTGGLGKTQTFRLCLRGYIDHFLPRAFSGRKTVALSPEGIFSPQSAGRLTETEKERFELICFTALNRFWREVGSVRDLHYAPLPLVIAASEDALLFYQKELHPPGRQIFFLLP